jgi:hypothetical protein
MGSRSGVKESNLHFTSFAEWTPADCVILLLCTKTFDNPAVLVRIPLRHSLVPIQQASIMRNCLAIHWRSDFFCFAPGESRNFASQRRAVGTHRSVPPGGGGSDSQPARTGRITRPSIRPGLRDTYCSTVSDMGTGRTKTGTGRTKTVAYNGYLKRLARGKLKGEQEGFRMPDSGAPVIVACPSLAIGPGDDNLTPPLAHHAGLLKTAGLFWTASSI